MGPRFRPQIGGWGKFKPFGANKRFLVRDGPCGFGTPPLDLKRTWAISHLPSVGFERLAWTGLGVEVFLSVWVPYVFFVTKELVS